MNKLFEFPPFVLAESLAGKALGFSKVSADGVHPVLSVQDLPLVRVDYPRLPSVEHFRYQTLWRELLGWPMCTFQDPTLRSEPPSLLEDWRVFTGAVKELEDRLPSPGRTFLCLLKKERLQVLEVWRQGPRVRLTPRPDLETEMEYWARGAGTAEESFQKLAVETVFRWPVPEVGGPLEWGQSLLSALNVEENWVHPLARHASPLSKPLNTDNSCQV